MVELQHNSERWRQRATNVGMEPEDGGNGRWICGGPGSCKGEAWKVPMEGTVKWNDVLGIPKMFWRTLVGWNLDVHILFVFGGKWTDVVLESDAFLQLWVSHRHRLLQEFGDMAQHTKAVLKSVSIAPVDPTGEKGVLFCCESFFAASKSEHMWKDNSASYIFSEWLYCKIAIIFGVQNTIDTSSVQQDFLPSLFRVKFFAYPASWCKRLPTRWLFLVAFSTHENPQVLSFHPVLMTLKKKTKHVVAHRRQTKKRWMKFWDPKAPKVKLGGAFHVGVEVDGIEWSTTRYWRPPGQPASLFFPPKKHVQQKKTDRNTHSQKHNPKCAEICSDEFVWGGVEIRLEFVAGKKTNM